MQPQKRLNDLCSFPRQTIQYQSNLSLCPSQWCWRSWSWMALWRPTRPSSVAQMVKRLPTMRETWVRSLGWEVPLEKEMAVFLPGKSHGQRSSVGCSPWGHKESYMTERLHFTSLQCKSRKSRDTWSNRQVWPWNTEWSRAKANRVWPRECTGS